VDLDGFGAEEQPGGYLTVAPVVGLGGVVVFRSSEGIAGLVGTVGDVYGKGPMESTPLQESSSRRNCRVTGW
jgi:hypothetical protein